MKQQAHGRKAKNEFDKAREAVWHGGVRYLLADTFCSSCFRYMGVLVCAGNAEYHLNYLAVTNR